MYASSFMSLNSPLIILAVMVLTRKDLKRKDHFRVLGSQLVILVTELLDSQNTLFYFIIVPCTTTFAHQALYHRFTVNCPSSIPDLHRTHIIALFLYFYLNLPVYRPHIL